MVVSVDCDTKDRDEHARTAYLKEARHAMHVSCSRLRRRSQQCPGRLQRKAQAKGSSQIFQLSKSPSHPEGTHRGSHSKKSERPSGAAVGPYEGRSASCGRDDKLPEAVPGRRLRKRCVLLDPVISCCDSVRTRFVKRNALDSGVMKPRATPAPEETRCASGAGQKDT